MNMMNRMRSLALKWAMACAIVSLATMLAAPAAGAQEPGDFADLTPGQRVYDSTGMSLTSSETMNLEERLQSLGDLGADAVIYIRALDATPEETLDQVEALQQAWVSTTGTDQDNAVAILINRNPANESDARAGIFVGSTFDDGNVPRGEQIAIVDEELIPPLRNGDVYQSLTGGINRLESSIVNGPPESAFESWSADAGSSWIPWASVAAAVIGLISLVSFNRRTDVIDARALPRTTERPSNDLSPALAGALVLGSPQSSAFPATILDLARRNALDIEPESEGGVFSKPKIQIRLTDHDLVQGDVEEAAWTELAKHADDAVVSSRNLQKAAGAGEAVRKAVERQLLARDWLDPNAGRNRAPFIAVFLVPTLLALACFVIAFAGGNFLPLIGTAALAGVAVAALVLYSKHPTLTLTGQEQALPWNAYRKGLERAAKDTSASLDLDAVLADTVAMNLGSKMAERLKGANESGAKLRAFTSHTGVGGDAQIVAGYPWWVAFNSTVATSSGTAATVSGAGAGGGGGAAGST